MARGARRPARAAIMPGTYLQGALRRNEKWRYAALRFHKDRAVVVSLGREFRPVSNARLGHDQGRAGGIGFDLPAEVGDVDAEVLLRVAGGTAPHGIEDLLMGQGAPGVRDERAQD